MSQVDESTIILVINTNPVGRQYDYIPNLQMKSEQVKKGNKRTWMPLDQFQISLKLCLLTSRHSRRHVCHSIDTCDTKTA